MSTEAYSGPVRDVAADDEDGVVEEVASPLSDSSMALTAIDRASIDMQVSTAKKYPRSVARSLKEAMDLACLDEATAESMFYSLPRGGKKIEGPSARLAEIMAYTWSNLRVDADIVAEDRTTVTAMGTCFDLERNVAIRVRVSRRITNKQGRRFDEDMIGVTKNAAISIALRNSVFKVVPRALVDRIYLAAREASLGKGGTLAQKRQNAMATFAKMGVTEAEIFAVLEVEGIDDIGTDELITLKGLKTAIKDGDTTVEETFRPSTKSEGAQTLNSAINEKKAAKPVSATTTSQPSASKKEEPATSNQQPATAGRVCEKCGGKDGVHKPDCEYYSD